MLQRLVANPTVRLFLTLGLLVLVALKIDPVRLIHAASVTQPAYLVIALALTVPFLLLKALRWFLLLRAADVLVTPNEALLSLVGGMGLALLTPGRVGELVRVSYLRDPRKWRIGGLVMLDKGFDVLVLCILSVAGAWRLLGPLSGAVLLAVSLAGVAVVYRPGPVVRLLRRFSARLPLAGKLEAVWDSIEALRPRITTDLLLLTALAFLVVLLQFGVILLNWRGWSPDVVLLTFPLVILSNVLPITIGGLGVREGLAALLLGHYGVPAADAALAAFLMFAFNTALPGVVGALLLPAASRVSAPEL